MKNTAVTLPLELTDVSLRAGKNLVIKNLSCRFANQPQCSVVIGPNGAGKSMFLKLCHGLVTPNSGRITWAGGENSGRHGQFQAMVLQRPVLLRRSVNANIAFVLKSKKLSRTERDHQVAEALDHAGLSRYSNTPARRLSVGEQQRLALARAWAVRPELLLLDEPSANLDPAATHLIENIIQEAMEWGAKIIMTTHDLHQARRLADEILFLHRGRLKERAVSEKFFAGPQNDLAQAFLKGELLWWHRRSMCSADENLKDG